jgi:hypothetical protein
MPPAQCGPCSTPVGDRSAQQWRGPFWRWQQAAAERRVGATHAGYRKAVQGGAGIAIRFRFFLAPCFLTKQGTGLAGPC